MSANWQQLSETLWSAYRSGDGQPHGSFGISEPYLISESRRVLARVEASLRERVDQACGNWTEARVWPPASNDVMFLIRLRLYFGWLTAQTLATPFSTSLAAAKPNPEMAEHEHLKWLLVDCWSATGVNWWLNDVSAYEEGAAVVLRAVGDVNFLIQPEPEAD